jgi:hypothetical protein
VTQINTGPVPTSAADFRPTTDIYTALLIIATVLLGAGTVLVAVRSQQLFGSIFPPAGG